MDESWYAIKVQVRDGWTHFERLCKIANFFQPYKLGDSMVCWSVTASMKESIAIIRICVAPLSCAAAMSSSSKLNGALLLVK